MRRLSATFLLLSACTVVERPAPAVPATEPPPATVAEPPPATVAEPPPPAPQPPPIVPEPTPPPYAPPRVITGFSPTAGTPGTTVMVVGENFGPSDGVMLEQVLPGGATQELVLPVVRRGAGFI